MAQKMLNDSSPRAIGVRLQRIRMMAGLEQYELAKAADVSKTSISYWETGRSPIKPRNVLKVINVIRNHGVECDEHWLLTGIGITPRLSFLMGENELTYVAQTPVQQIAALECELKLFLTYHPQAVVLPINNNDLLPYLRRGDYIAGEWVGPNDFKENQLCIIEYQSKLVVRYVMLTENAAQFYVQELPSSTKQLLVLEKIAPLVRVWR